MALATLVIPNRCRRNGGEISIDNPSWAQVEEAIVALNNSALCDLYLYPRKDSLKTYLCIAGGAGRYVLTGLIQDKTCPTLVDPTRSANPAVQLRMDGELVSIPNNWVMDLSATLKAANAFFEAGDFNCGIAWHML